jgi:hypothetical protein
MRRRLVTGLMIAFAAAMPRAQQPPARGLRIVVIEGEDAVNVIQQKSAVRPLIELRDYNDLPVGGATVTFSILGGQATFGGGVTQVTVTTDAAGRAAAASLNAVSRGQVSIRIEAAFQGQTATATVSQTNVATAAEAARLGQSGGSGGSTATTGAAAGGATGGGLSGAAIAGIVGGVAAGAAVGLKAASGGDDGGSTDGGGGGNAGGGGGGGGGTAAPPCTFSVSPTTISTSSTPSTTNVAVTVQPSNCTNPTWTPSTTATFFTLSGGPAQGPFNGSSQFGVNIPENRTGMSRSGTLSITPNGPTVQITQAANCTFTVMPTSFGTISGLATGDVVAVMLANSPCDPQTWTAFSNQPQYVSVNPTSGSGSGVVNVTFTQHFGTGPRPVSITAAGHTVSGTQLPAGTPLTACHSRALRGGDVADTQVVELGRQAGSFLLTYDTGARSADRIVVRYDGQVLFDTGCVRTSRAESRLLRYAGTSSRAIVEVIPNCAGGTGSTWAIDVACPR